MKKPPSTIRSGLAMFDMHFPCHDKRAYELVMQFAEDFKPDIFVNGGDLGHFAGISHWNKKKIKLRNDYPIKIDLDLCREHHRRQREINPNAIIYTLDGNHEYWINDWLLEHPEMEGMFDYRQMMGITEFGIKYIKPEQQPISIGKLRFAHGWYTNKYHAQKHAQAIHHNLVYGHAHDVQSFTPDNIEPNHRFMAWSLGHLSDERKADYLRCRPTNWMLAFGVFYVNTETGGFTMLPIPLPNYEFIFNGKGYKG